MIKILSIIFTPLIILILISSSIYPASHISYAEKADHIVISEIQISGDTEGLGSTDEFIEFYNPSDTPIDLKGWTLNKKTQSINAEEIVVATLSGQIQARGFYLAAHENYNGTASADIIYNTNSIASNNTLLLRNSSEAVIDKVGMGTALDFEGEDAASSPANNRSIERKAFSDSSAEDMTQGGEHENSGNGEDSDNNNLDFVLRPVLAGSNPQNSQSPIETDINDSPTPTITTEPTITTMPSETPAPTVSITPTISPTDQPIPTEGVSPTQIPTPSHTPIPTSTVTPRNIRLLGFFPFSRTVCYIDYSKGIFAFPKISCVRI